MDEYNRLYSKYVGHQVRFKEDGSIWTIRLIDSFCGKFRLTGWNAANEGMDFDEDELELVEGR